MNDLFVRHLISQLTVLQHYRHMVWVVYEDVHGYPLVTVSWGRHTGGFLSCTRTPGGHAEIDEVGIPIWGF